MTTTTLINAVTVGVTPSAASNITKWTLAATSVGVSLEFTFTPGAVEKRSVRVWWAVAATSLTANAAAVEQLKRAGNCGCWESRFDLPLVANIESSKLQPATGGYVYLWVEEGTLGAAGTLTVKGTEV